MKHRYQSFTRIGRQFQSLERQVYADWTSVSFPLCQRSCLTWRIMTNTLTNTHVVIFLSASIFGRGYHSRYQNFEFTDLIASSLSNPFLHIIQKEKFTFKIQPGTIRNVCFRSKWISMCWMIQSSRVNVLYKCSS